MQNNFSRQVFSLITKMLFFRHQKKIKQANAGKIKRATLNLSYFISSRISRSNTSSFSSVIHKIAIASVGLGLAVMLVSFLILRGFQDNIKTQVISFTGHLQLSRFTSGNMYSENPVPASLDTLLRQEKLKYISHVQKVANKPGLLKTKEEVQGVVLKGVGSDFARERFAPNLTAGELPVFTDTAVSSKVVISRKIADKLRLSLNDEVIMYFVQNPPRFRRLQVEGIYSTGMEDFDESVIIGDLRLVQQLNNWGDSLVGGYEFFAEDFDKLEQAQEELYNATSFSYFIEKVTNRNIQIFEWLGLLDRNVIILLAIILFVAFINIISILLILIMERTPMIGTLMSLGADNSLLRRTFLVNGMQMVLKGIVWGNFIGLGFAVVQYYFKIIPLDRNNYYMDYVPIQWNWILIVLLNLLVVFIALLVMLIPTIVISRINPIKAIKFD